MRKQKTLHGGGVFDPAINAITALYTLLEKAKEETDEVYHIRLFFANVWFFIMLMFVIVYIVKIIQYTTLGDPLNKDHPAFKFTTMVDIGSRWTLSNVFTTYRVFLLLPAIVLIFSLSYLIYIVLNKKPYDAAITWTFLAVFGISCVILIATFGVIKAGTPLVRSDIKSINKVNEFITTHLYNSSDFNVLSQPDVDRLHQITTYQTLLNTVLANQPSSEEFAKALFTINLYLTFNEIGSRHKNVQDALNMFHLTKRLTNNNFADFLSPKTIYIQDRIAEILANVRDIDEDRPMRLDAKTMATKWITDLNSTLGAISYSSAALAFIIVTIGLYLIYMGVAKGIPAVIAFVLSKRASN